jgi:hypothetical protein
MAGTCRRRCRLRVENADGGTRAFARCTRASARCCRFGAYDESGRARSLRWFRGLPRRQPRPASAACARRPVDLKQHPTAPRACRWGDEGPQPERAPPPTLFARCHRPTRSAARSASARPSRRRPLTSPSEGIDHVFPQPVDAPPAKATRPFRRARHPRIRTRGGPSHERATASDFAVRLRRHRAPAWFTARPGRRVPDAPLLPRLRPRRTRPRIPRCDSAITENLRDRSASPMAAAPRIVALRRCGTAARRALRLHPA